MSLSTATTPTVLLLNSISYAWSVESQSILSDINLSVNQGEIFGLLGASGCGKTTLVRLILGRLFPSSGIISLLGNRIDGPRNPHRSSDIGYMPQDLVLYQQFTTVEMLTYFGQLYQLASREIKNRIEFVLKLLNLHQFVESPKVSQMINQLSGGQKRRISLAIALLHKPRFLILDEPTVGVDPLLRETIWNHLKQVTGNQSSPVSVFLTTHYIEEAREAQSVGFLRNGRLLIQDSPSNLLDQFNTSSMEKVFLQLCRQAQEQQSHDNLSTTSSVIEFPLEAVKVQNGDLLETMNLQNKSEFLPPMDIRTSSKILSPLNILTSKKKVVPKHSTKPTITSNSKTKFPTIFTLDHFRSATSILKPSGQYTFTGISRREHFICWPHLLTLMSKSVRQLRRNQSLLIFFILLPAIEIALIMMCIGRDIDHIPIAVYNGEYPHADLSNTFLDSVPEGAFIRQDYKSPAEALKAVQDSKAHALLQFSPRFSNALRTRFFTIAFDDGSSSSVVSSNETTTSTNEDQSIWQESSVYSRLDMSNQLIGLQVQRQLLNAFLNFAQRLASNLGLSNHTFKPPLVFGPPVYGIQGGASAVVETFIAPGALIMIAFFATTIVTCHLLIHEVREGLIERALIAGASSSEFLFSHIIIQSSILMIQLLMMLFTAFKLFSMPFLGSLPLSIALIILQGLWGLMYGLMLSATYPDEIYATTLAIGTFFPSVIIGGIFWPVQSMPIALQYLSACLPSTQSIDALRSILLRNWGLNTANVAGAFAITTFWLCVFLMCALRNFKRRI